MKKFLYLILISLILSGCKTTPVRKTHGISYLEKREKLIVVNKANKNDVVDILGHPSTKGMTDDNLWIYIERTISKKSILKLGKNYLEKNNVLVLEFNKYGIISKKDFYDINDMKKVSFAENINLVVVLVSLPNITELSNSSSVG